MYYRFTKVIKYFVRLYIPIYLYSSRQVPIPFTIRNDLTTNLFNVSTFNVTFRMTCNISTTTFLILDNFIYRYVSKDTLEIAILHTFIELIFV